jgi:hypothetical protein
MEGTTQATNEGEEGKVANVDLTGDKVYQYLDENNDVFVQYLSKKAGKEISSLDEFKIIEEKVVEKVVEVEAELPEDVKRVFEFTKKTGRGVEDFMKAHKDWTKDSKESVVMEYIRQTEELEGDVLDEYYSLKYSPKEDDSTDKEIRAAKIEFERTYSKALKYLNEQKKGYEIPAQKYVDERTAINTEMENQRKFSEGMLGAIEGLNEIEVDGFKYKIEDKPTLKESMKSLDSIMSKYKKNGELDYSLLARDLISGQKLSSIVKASNENALSRYIESEAKKINEIGNPSNSQKSTSVDGRKVAQRIFGV